METIIITANHTIRKMQKRNELLICIYFGCNITTWIAQQTIMHYADERVSVRRLDTSKEITKERKKTRRNAHTPTRTMKIGAKRNCIRKEAATAPSAIFVYAPF